MRDGNSRAQRVVSAANSMESMAIGNTRMLCGRPCAVNLSGVAALSEAEFLVSCEGVPLPLAPTYIAICVDFHRNCARGRHAFTTPTAVRRLHAAGEPSHRCMAVSRRISGREFQLRAFEETHADAGAREDRCVFHGR